MSETSVNLPVILTGSHALHNKSKGFQSLIRGVGDSKTKHEEDKVIKQELIRLKEHFVSVDVTSKQTRELLIRLIYCELLGHDAAFGYIYAIKFAEQSSFLEKRTGYLAATIFLHKGHQLVMLLINTLRKDLQGTNVISKCAALNVICKLIDSEMIPALLPLIISALEDKRAEVRKKALTTLQGIHTLNKSLVPNIKEHLANALCDRDPAVVSASLHLFYDLVKENPVTYRVYLKPFLQVLRQIIEGKLSEFNFHGVQAPWIQIKLLKILALLGRGHKSTSEGMSAVLLQMVNSLPTDCNIGCAVMFECIRTITIIYPVKTLLDAAARKTGLFLTSNSSDLKCSGIIAMTALVQVDLNYAADPQQQQIIIDCLSDDDHTIRKKTLELLYKITNRGNVIVVFANLLNYLKSTTEYHIRTEVAAKLTELAEKHAPDLRWYIQTINDVIKAADIFVSAEVGHHLMKLISEADDDDKKYAVSKYIEVINNKSLPDTLVQISCWVIGEYGYLVKESCSLPNVLFKVSALLDRKFTDRTTRGWIVTAIAKLTRSIGVYLPEARGIIDRYRTGFPAELRQRCHEISILAADISLMETVFAVNCKEENYKVCPTLSFLDDYVAEALSFGADPYKPSNNVVTRRAGEKPEKPAIRTTPYEDPLKKKVSQRKKDTTRELEESVSVESTSEDNKRHAMKTASASMKGSQSSTPAVWGPAGYSGNIVSKQNDDDESQHLQTNVTGSSSKSSGSCQDIPNKKTSSEKPQETCASSSSFDEGPKQQLSSVFSGVVQAKETPTIETSYDSGQPSPLTDILIEPCSTDVSSAAVNSDCTPKQHQQLELHLNDKTLVKGTLLLESSDSTLNTSQESGNIEESSLTGDQLTLQDKGELETDNDKNAPLLEEELLVDLDSDVVEDSLTSTSPFDREPLECLTTWDQEEEISCKNSCLTPKLEHSWESNKTLPLNEHDSITKLDSIHTATDLFRSCDRSNELCSDSNVRLVCFSQLKPLELVLSLQLTNHCQTRAAVENVLLKTDPPSNLVAKISSNSINADSLEFLNTLTQEIPLTCQYPALHMVFKGTVSYNISGTSKVLYFNQEIPSKDLLRPMNMTTEDFGESWKSTSNDVRQEVRCTSSKPCKEMMEIIAAYVNLAVVDIIDCEGIAAGTVLGKDICLLHCRFLKKDKIAPAELLISRSTLSLHNNELTLSNKNNVCNVDCISSGYVSCRTAITNLVKMCC